MAAFHSLNKDLVCELLTYLSPSMASSLALTAHQFLDDARTALYRRVRIRGHGTARLFFRTMHACSVLYPSSPPLTKTVLLLHLLREGPHFPGEYDDILQGDDFDYGLQAMSSLETVHLELRIDFQSFKNRCNYDLSEFSYDGPMEQEIYNFLFLTPTLTTVLLKHDLQLISTGRWVEKDLLPNVNHLSMTQQEAIVFIENHPIVQLTLEYPDLFRDYQTVYSALPLSQFRSKSPITFFQAAPAQWFHGPHLARYLPELETAAILQDGSWTTHGLSRRFPELVTELVKALNYLPNLTTILLLTRLGPPELVVFQDALQKHCTHPALRQLTFHTPIECITLPDWRSRSIYTTILHCKDHISCHCKH
ncbi:hypothetical protein C8J57DRAFT_1222644 [Mycena rebaudengoi]|nr:hypothetical protein C8J57DRAFT_1222644 [Mycena rebaudengoi]